MSIHLQIGNEAITSYKRLAYTPWHAIAELVDNSTQSYFDNKDKLDKAGGNIKPVLTVKIDYDPDVEILRVEDNAMGMSYKELENALKVAHPPSNTSGRSKYGMGLKTSACWIGNEWTVLTKKLGETTEYTITVDVEKIASGDNILKQSQKTDLPKSSHYTIIEIRNHNRKFKGQTLGKIERFLGSMYREDFRQGILNLMWRDERITWIDLDDRLRKDHDGKLFKKKFAFEIKEDGQTKKVRGWIGIFEKGSRKDAGFSILHSGRVIRGYPDPWRPNSIFGQEQGSNDLANQRLVGEIHFDDFDVSHTKDDILWLGEQEDLVQAKLLEICEDYRKEANTPRKGNVDQRGPSELDTEEAVYALKEEMESKELRDIVSINPMLTKKLVDNVVKSVKEYVVSNFKEKFTIKIIDGLTVKVYIESDMSTNDPYVTIDSAKSNQVIVIVNSAHPHWNQLDNNSISILNYLRHCVYDGVAEWQSRKFVGNLLPDSIKILKDRLLRLPLDIERSKNPTKI